MTPAWRWITESVALAIHDQQIAEHGGSPGTRDLALIQSTLDRPRNIAAYASPDAATLAASYAFGLSRNHGFIDGNKRTAFVVANIFLLDNGYDLNAEDTDIVGVMRSLAAGKIDEAELAAWFRRFICAAEPD